MRERRRIQITKEKSSYELFLGDIILYIKALKTQKLLQLINTFNKVTGYKVNTQKSVVFLCMHDKHTKK